MTNPEQPPEDGGTKPTREAMRDEAGAYRELAKRLAKGKPVRLPDPPFDQNLRDAVDETRRVAMKARPRQLRRLAQLLRAVSLVDLNEALRGNTAELWATREVERANEAWRARLLAEGDAALSDFVAEHHEADRTRLRQLLRQVTTAPEGDRLKKASTALFRFIREAREPRGRA